MTTIIVWADGRADGRMGGQMGGWMDGNGEKHSLGMHTFLAGWSL